MKRAGLCVLIAVTALCVAPSAWAQESEQELFDKGVAALGEGSYERAIAVFEALADRGFAHPDAAYNRGLAYLARVRAHAEHPGDLGRSAAGFEECLQQRPSDADAELAADLVRAEVARRRAVRGGPAVVQARPSIDRAIVGLAPERIWALCAMVASLLLAAGLLLRRFSRPAPRLAALIAVPIGAIGLLVFGVVTLTARHLRHTTTAAVVVTPEVRLLDERGVALNSEPVPEAARVEVIERRGALSRIRYGSGEGWAGSSGLRLMPR